jgi:basic amino acid/polyamine antiporter, APA family
VNKKVRDKAHPTAATERTEIASALGLRREVGLAGAAMMGLGSIVGTGVFVSIGIAAGLAGPAVTLAIALAAVVATCNALNSAQLAASHPVSGGTYEYGYKYLNPWLGFTAGWMFLCAKTASAATAALGFAGYVLTAAGQPGDGMIEPFAVGAVAVLTLIVLTGIRQSSRTNIVIVSVTLLALIGFCLTGLPTVLRQGWTQWEPFFFTAQGDGDPISNLLHATALMFVAYTGYGRIATLGEEVREPERTIPRAIVVTLVVSALLYLAVGAVGIGAAGAMGMASATESRAAPLEVISRQFDIPGIAWLVAVGAVTAMLGVLLNLILGLSRVLLAMARRGDMPGVLARLDRSGATPFAAVIVVGLLIGGLTLLGDVKTTWSFSALTVLIYYAITNLAALRLPATQQLYPRALAFGGLAACLFLTIWIDLQTWIAGGTLLIVGLLWRLAASRRSGLHRAEQS